MEQDQNQTQQQQVLVPNMIPFNPKDVRKSYRSGEWSLKEDYYVQEIQKINIPQSPNPADIANTANQIETILSLARMDMAFIQPNYESYDRCLKIEEKRLFVELKINPPQNFAGLKFTVDEMKGVVTNVLKNGKWGATQLSLYDIVIESEKRYLFMCNVLQALCDKKDLLITHSSVIKAEASLNSMGSGNNNAGNRQQHVNYQHANEE